MTSWILSIAVAAPTQPIRVLGSLYTGSCIAPVHHLWTPGVLCSFPLPRFLIRLFLGYFLARSHERRWDACTQPTPIQVRISTGRGIRRVAKQREGFLVARWNLPPLESLEFMVVPTYALRLYHRLSPSVEFADAERSLFQPLTLATKTTTRAYLPY
jgi:hypothetical protein